MKRVASPEPKSRLLRPTRAAKMTRDQLKPSEPLSDNAPDVAASSVRLATAAARPNWNKVLVVVVNVLTALGVDSCNFLLRSCSNTCGLSCPNSRSQDQRYSGHNWHNEG